MNSAVGRQQGISDEHPAELVAFESDERFSEREKVVLRFTEGVTRTLAEVPDEVFDEMRRYFTTSQIVEITEAIALENFRSRFNRAFKIDSDGFCELPADHPVRSAMLRVSSSVRSAYKAGNVAPGRDHAWR